MTSASVVLPIRRLPSGAGLPLPGYATAGAAGIDLYAALGDPVVLWPGEKTFVPTGISMALPAGYEGQVRPRSGLAMRYGITVINSPGTIDSDYRGEIIVGLVNLGSEPHRIERGHRIAQLVVAPVVRAMLIEVDDLDTTPRGSGALGSTGD